MIVEVVIHAEAAPAVSDLRRRQGSHVSEIILTEHTDHTVKLVPVLQSGDVFVPVKICLDLLVQRQHLRHLVQILIDIFTNQLSLLSDDVLQ